MAKKKTKTGDLTPEERKQYDALSNRDMRGFYADEQRAYANTQALLASYIFLARCALDEAELRLGGLPPTVKDYEKHEARRAAEAIRHAQPLSDTLAHCAEGIRQVKANSFNIRYGTDAELLGVQERCDAAEAQAKKRRKPKR